MAERSQLCQERCYGAAQKRLPVLQWLPKYSLQWLQLDLIAGLTVGLTVVPQALAYAEVAGLPVQYGLYSSFMGCFIYCLLGTSKDVTLGPTAIMSLLVSSYAFHDPVYAILLSFLSGCIQMSQSSSQNELQKKKRRAPPPPTPTMPSRTEELEDKRKSTVGNGRHVPQKPRRGNTRGPPHLVIPPPPPYPPPDRDTMDPTVLYSGADVTDPTKLVPELYCCASFPSRSKPV